MSFKDFFDIFIKISVKFVASAQLKTFSISSGDYFARTRRHSITWMNDDPHPLHWRHNESDGVSNHCRFHCLLNCWFRWRSKRTSKLRVTGLCEGNSSGTDEFPVQKASNAENVSIWWRHHVNSVTDICVAKPHCGKGCDAVMVFFVCRYDQVGILCYNLRTNANMIFFCI